MVVAYVKLLYYFTLCTYKNTSFSFSNKCFFWGLDSKSEIPVFWKVLENPDNPEKNHFFRIIEVFRCRRKNRLQNWIRQVEKPFINASLIR